MMMNYGNTFKKKCQEKFLSRLPLLIWKESSEMGGGREDLGDAGARPFQDTFFFKN
jgi:hypothetical protein